MSFKKFREKVQAQVLNLLGNETLYLTGVDKDRLYDLYLSSFPVGTNNLFLERTEHDCSACRQFIRTFGGVVAIEDNKVVSVWDLEGLDSTYAPVAKALTEYVKYMPIVDRFMHNEAKIGIESNIVQLKTGEVHEWTHLHAVLPAKFVVRKGESVGSAVSEMRDRKNVFMRSLTELTRDSVETVLDLISQNSLYRGLEFKPLLESFLREASAFAALPAWEQDIFCWDRASKLSPSISKIRNSAIGALLIDISEGLDLDKAVRKFESVVAPVNYKRPKPVFSKKMLDDAQKKVEELGLLNSLQRRFATIEDIRIQNILFGNIDVMRQTMKLGVFEEMSQAIPVSPKVFSNVEEVPIDRFVSDILPRVTAIEVLLENRHAGNLASLIAPVDPASPSMFKWSNGFSWSYSGNIADSMKQRVKEAGGNVDGVLRFSIQWNEDFDNQNDFDAHCIEPSGLEIYFRNKTRVHPSSGVLDVDIISPGNKIAVENITYSDLSRMPNGEYLMFVNTYSDNGGKSGFRAEIEFNGEIYSFDYPKPTRSKEIVEVARIVKTDRGFSIKKSLGDASKTLWNKQTNQFHPVTAMMTSPNYWDGEQGVGNKHFFFLLNNCINDTSPNGFFNEFLRNDLMPHKRVFEALGRRMQVVSDDPKQLSGLGFSSTQRNSVVARLTGHVQRTIKITF